MPSVRQIAVPVDRHLLQAARHGPGRDRDADGVPAVHRAGGGAVLGQRGRALATLEDRSAVLAVLLGRLHAVAGVHPAAGSQLPRRQQDTRRAGRGNHFAKQQCTYVNLHISVKSVRQV